MDAKQTTTEPLVQWLGNPWLLVVALLIPLLLLIRFRRTYPTPRLALLTAMPFMLALLLPWMPSWWWSLVLTIDGALLVWAIFDLPTIPRLDLIEVTRTIARVASLGKPQSSEVQIDNRGRRKLHLLLTEDASVGLEILPGNQRCRLGPQQRAKLEFKLTATRRGAYPLEHIYARIFSWSGLWCRQHAFPCKGELHVYPDIQQIAKYALLARTNRLNLIGVRRTKKAGQENDFERLRDYLPDDNYKHIDWRSTARRQKMTVKQFQTDQSQRVIFMLDCGRMMTNEYERLSLLDYAFNSILMLSYVALEQGDSVGLLCFSDHVHKYVPPSGGKRQMNRLLHAGFDQFPRLVQSRFDDAFLYLSAHCRRRSLVVLVTNVIDQVNAQQIHNYMNHLVGTHLPLVVLLRDHRIFQAADNPAPDEEVLFRSAAAGQILTWRHQVLHRMQASGTLTLDLFPDDMTAPMVNQYLDIKARHLL